MNEEKIVQIVEKLLNSKNPVNIEGKVEDLDEFILIFEDGHFSSRGFQYLFNPKTYTLIAFNRSNHQGEKSSYINSNFESYIEDMMSVTDKAHFERYVRGLKKIFKAYRGKGEGEPIF